MNYYTLRHFDVANGQGVRCSLFVSGCNNHCPGCFNSCAKAFDAGQPFTKEIEDDILKTVESKYIEGLSLLGGDPMATPNQYALLPFLHRYREKFGDTKPIWCWTGYVYETELITEDGRGRCEVTDEFLSLIDVLIDGPFVQSLYDIRLKFRGSSNQRILQLHPFKDVSKSI